MLFAFGMEATFVLNQLGENKYYLNADYVPANIYLFKISNRNKRKRWDIYPNLAIKTPEKCHWCRSGVFTGEFAHIFFSCVGILARPAAKLEHILPLVAIVGFKTVSEYWVIFEILMVL